MLARREGTFGGCVLAGYQATLSDIPLIDHDNPVFVLSDIDRGVPGIMPVLVEAVESHITLGEISDQLRQVFGLFKETLTI